MLRENEAQYIKSVCGQVKCREAHGCIEKELSAHIRDQREAYMGAGMGEQAASDAAVREMGDARLVGKSMDRAYRPHIPAPILAVFAAIVLFGCAARIFEGETQAAATAVALAFFFAAWRFICLGTLMKRACAVCAVLAAVLWATAAVPFIAPGTGAEALIPYISLFQPFAVALLLRRFSGRGISGMLRAIGAGLLMLIPCALVSEFMTALLLVVDAALVIYAVACGLLGEKRLRLLAVLAALALAGLLLVFLLLSEHQRTRLPAMLGLDCQDNSYFTYKVREILGSCRFFGGAEAGAPIFAPDDASQFFFMVRLAQGAGLWIYCALGGLLCAFSAYTLKSCLKLKGRSIRLSALAIVLTICAQWIICFAANMGFAVSAISMPFISVGGMSIITNMTLMGLLLNIVGKGRFFGEAAIDAPRPAL